jgi:arylsulfatase A-like enzyme
MTGRYQTRFGHEFNGAGPKFGLPESEKTIADRFKALGYATCAVGKWHLGMEPQFRPMKRGFDEFYGTLANTPFFHPQLVDSRVSPDPKRVESKEFYTTDAFADRAVDWLDRVKGKPFFLYLPFNAQHGPLQATKKYLDRFGEIEDEKRRTFAAMMSAMDDAVGRVLQKLKNLGQEENTLIFFFSDNGGPTKGTTSKNGPLRGVKATTLEGGVRVPFLVQWKGKLAAGKTYEHPVIQLDILPTCLAAADAKISPEWKLDGVNLLPYLTGENKRSPHDALYWRFGQQWAIRKSDWKLVASNIDGATSRLFNLANDIGEEHDLAAKEPEKVNDLTANWKAWNAEQKDPLWEPNRPKRRANRQNAVPK